MPLASGVWRSAISYEVPAADLRVLLHLEHLRRPFPARPELAVQLHELPAVLQRLCSGAHLEDRPAADHFFCLGERAVGDRQLALLDAKPHGGGAGLEAAGVDDL